MGKGKLAKFADVAANPLVVECPFRADAGDTEFPLRGNWRRDFFRNPNPIVLELGCGRGEYAVGLAQAFPQRNYIGVDIKGARMWTGAQEALRKEMGNVAFLRTNIEFIHRCFATDEVSELWLTFSDPQMKKPTKRLTSTHFLLRYRHFLADGGLVHLKTDSNFLFAYTCGMLRANNIPCEAKTGNLYADSEETTAQARSIQTYYERMWMAQGIDIKYLRFRLPKEGGLAEPDIEIPYDDYRSYNRARRGDKTAGK